MTPQEALAKRLLPILKAGSFRGYWSSDDPYMHPMDWNIEATSLFADALIPALTSAGYALVPVKEALTVERIAAALFEMHADPTSVEDRHGRPIWEGFGWSRGPSPTDVHPAGMWGPELRKAFAAALLAALETSEVTK